MGKMAGTHAELLRKCCKAHLEQGGIYNGFAGMWWLCIAR
jgi:hypothetical protein